MLHYFRYSLLYRKVRRKYDDDIQRSLQYILAKGQIGDWFVLYQLSKNCNVYFFREFIRELAIDLKEKPKKSKSIGSSSKIKICFYLFHCDPSETFKKGTIVNEGKGRLIL